MIKEPDCTARRFPLEMYFPEALEKGGLAWQVMQGKDAADQIDPAWGDGAQIGHVALDEFDAIGELGRLQHCSAGSDHRFRKVQPDDAQIWATASKVRKVLTRTTAKIKDHPASGDEGAGGAGIEMIDGKESAVAVSLGMKRLDVLQIGHFIGRFRASIESVASEALLDQHLRDLQ